MASRWVSVTGSRYYPLTKEQWGLVDHDTQLDAMAKGVALVDFNIDQFPDDWGVVTGGAKGPDTWAENAARARGLEVVVYQPDWKLYGKGAGLRRNTLIAEHADSCLVFWDGVSRGTNDFIKKAYDRRKEIMLIGPSGTPWAIYDDEWWEKNPPEEPPRMDIPKG